MDLHETLLVSKINKVSIIIEDDMGNTTTIKVPQAEKIDVISSPIPFGQSGRGQFVTDRVELKLEMTALFDKPHDYIYAIETSTVGVPVE